jgi:hypothetical protein
VKEAEGSLVQACGQDDADEDLRQRIVPSPRPLAAILLPRCATVLGTTKKAPSGEATSPVLGTAAPALLTVQVSVASILWRFWPNGRQVQGRKRGRRMALPKTRRIVIAALVLMLWTFVGVPGVAAAPVRNPGVQVITQTCNGVDYQFAVKHAGRSDNIPASAHMLGTSNVGILKTTDVEIYVDGVVEPVERFHLDWHKIGKGISEDRIVVCTNVIFPEDGVTIYAHNTLVFPQGWSE